MFFFRGCFRETATQHSQMSENYKAKLEQKLSLGKQDPEPVFDLVGCNLKNVPSGLYSWCKVCRKEVLLLNDNRLEFLNGGGKFEDLILLKVLDAQNNRLVRLPENIGCLKNLQVLSLESNYLKSLPESLGSLVNLKTLNLQNNILSHLPPSICQLLGLESLNITQNPLSTLPGRLHHLRALQDLKLDSERFVTPPSHICSQSLQAIMEYLLEMCGDAYSPVNPVPSNFLKSTVDIDERRRNSFDDSLQLLEQRRRQRLEIEKRIQEDLHNQTLQAMGMKPDRKKLLEQIALEEKTLNEELKLAQQRKEEGRQGLLQELLKVEQQSCEAVEKLLSLHEKMRNSKELSEIMDNERKEFEELFIKQQKKSQYLRRNEVLNAMYESLAQELQWVKEKETYNRKMTEIVASQDYQMDALVFEANKRKDLEQKVLLGELLKEEQYQKEAFATFMRCRDTENRRICEQIQNVENELARLTKLELKKQNLKLSFGLDLIAEQRNLLMQLLIQLLEDRKAREEELKKWLIEMENSREREQVDFWLKQYQALMDRKPQLLREEDGKHGEPQEESSCSVSPSKVTATTEVTTPTAPSPNDTTEVAALSLSTSEPSETTEQTMECVICLDKRCQIVFLPCGHYCCCEMCGQNVSRCPMCRSTVEQSIRVWAA